MVRDLKNLHLNIVLRKKSDKQQCKLFVGIHVEKRKKLYSKFKIFQLLQKYTFSVSKKTESIINLIISFNG